MHGNYRRKSLLNFTSEQEKIIEEALKLKEKVFNQSFNYNIDIEDIKQKIRIHVWRKLYLYDSKKSFRNWFVSLMRNQWINEVRNKISYNKKTERANYEYLIDNSTNNEYFFKDKVGIIGEKFFNSLNSIDKIIFSLRYEKGLSSAKIAGKIKMTTRNINIRIKKFIKPNLNRVENEEEFWF